jgi:hypothetical protein
MCAWAPWHISYRHSPTHTRVRAFQPNAGKMLDALDLQALLERRNKILHAHPDYVEDYVVRSSAPYFSAPQLRMITAWSRSLRFGAYLTLSVELFEVRGDHPTLEMRKYEQREPSRPDPAHGFSPVAEKLHAPESGYRLADSHHADDAPPTNLRDLPQVNLARRGSAALLARIHSRRVRARRSEEDEEAPVTRPDQQVPHSA